MKALLHSTFPKGHFRYTEITAICKQAAVYRTPPHPSICAGATQTAPQALLPELCRKDASPGEWSTNTETQTAQLHGALLCFRSPCQTPSSTFQTSKRALPASCSSAFAFLIDLKRSQSTNTSKHLLKSQQTPWKLSQHSHKHAACSGISHSAQWKADIWKAQLSKCTPANQSVHLAKPSAESHFCRAIQTTPWGSSLHAQRCSVSAASLRFLTSHSGVIILGRKPIKLGFGLEERAENAP